MRTASWVRPALAALVAAALWLGTVAATGFHFSPEGVSSRLQYPLDVGLRDYLKPLKPIRAPCRTGTAARQRRHHPWCRLQQSHHSL